MTNLIKYWYLHIEYGEVKNLSKVCKFEGVEAGSYAKIHRRNNNYYLKSKDAYEALAHLKDVMKYESCRSRGVKLK